MKSITLIIFVFIFKICYSQYAKVEYKLIGSDSISYKFKIVKYPVNTAQFNEAVKQANEKIKLLSLNDNKDYLYNQIIIGLALKKSNTIKENFNKFIEYTNNYIELYYLKQIK